MNTEPDQKEFKELEDIITDLVKSVVRNPEAVKISHLVRGPLVAFVIKTDQDDVRRVIGQRGKHFRALETIVRESLRRLGRESHLAIDEKGPPTIPSPQKAFALGKFDPAKFRSVTDVLTRVIALFVQDRATVSVTSTDIASTTILEVKVKAADYPSIYGKDAEFDYGTDGHIVGAIKNFFDGIGKNNGRIIKIAVAQV